MRRIIAIAAFLALVGTAGLGFASTKTGSHEGVRVSGKVVAIDNGLISLREPNGQIFRVAATSDRLEGIHVGDRVSIKDVKGWAVSINDMGKKTVKGSTGLTHKRG